MSISNEQAYLFRHAVMQEVAYQLQPPSERSRLHGRIVGIIEVLFPNSLEEHALALADHAFHAHQDESRGDATRTHQNQEVKYLALAAEVARRRFDNERAVSLLRRLAGLPWAPPRERFDAMEGAAGLLMDIARVGEAAEIVPVLIEQAQRSGIPEDSARAYLLLTRLAGLQRRAADAMVYAQQAEHFAGRSADRALRVSIFSELGVIYFRRGETAAARALFAKGVELARELGLRKELVSVLNRCGATAVMAGELDEGEKYLEEAEQLGRDLNDLRNVAAVLSNQGVLARRRNQYDEALRLYDESRNISERIGLRDNLINCYDNSGVVLNLLNRLEEAQDAHERARLLAIELGDPRREATSNLNAALIERKFGRFELALRMMDESFELLVKAGDLRGQINCLVNRGNVYLSNMDRPFDGLHDFIHAEMLARGSGDAHEATWHLTRQAAALQAMRCYEDAVTVCNRVLAQSSEYADGFDLARLAYFHRAFAEHGLERNEEALGSIRQYLHLIEDHSLPEEVHRDDIESAQALLKELTGD
ncbi:MAG: tetratricopeptide repeat protein [Planctomycetes bacterium]|nr:tetratricopeptide repeat protein [Planctomycetota bacterium]